MSTPSFAKSPDGTRIAYEAVGNGPTLVLLHGGFVQDRRAWTQAGYVDRLNGAFRLLVIDLRGHGESDRPHATEMYVADKLCADVLAVLDTESIERAHVWGYSFGAGVALQLAAVGSRIDRVVVAGAVLGRWLTVGAAQRAIQDLQVVAAAKQRGEIDSLPVHEMQKDFARKADLDVASATYRAMVTWPVIDAASVRRPTFFYAGSLNPLGVATITSHEAGLRKVGARWNILDGLDHEGELEAIDRVLPLCVEFLGG